MQDKKRNTKSKASIEVVRPPLSRTFDVPTPDDLLKVFEGDSVKLIFKGGGDVERMWVTVKRAGNMERWVGTLDNDPVLPGVMDRIKYGAIVHFHPYDVIDIDLHKRIDQREVKQEHQKNKIPENKISRPWYKNPQIITTIIVGIVGAAATIIAALL